MNVFLEKLLLQVTMAYRLTESTGWRHWVTPRPARVQPVHRWYLLPHSFTADLVHALIDEWGLDETDKILDPFSGAGTTLVAAKDRGIPASGYDLSPLAILASNTKTADYRRAPLQCAWVTLKGTLVKRRCLNPRRTYSELTRKALPDGRLCEFDTIAARIDQIEDDPSVRDFFRLALISVIPRFSRAVANGGWLRWVPQSAATEPVVQVFGEQVEMMMSDVRDHEPGEGRWRVQIADARSLPELDGTCTAVITSPPYPNRHDYTRVFGVELLFEFLDREQLRVLRYQSFHSHPEARPIRPSADGYKPPDSLEGNIRKIQDKRIQRMLRGYFLDIYLCIRELVRVCRGGARIAIVVGNARYAGAPILVDEYTAEIGESAGLTCQEIRAVRWRGNSAQQMGKYGRVASRESIVIFRK